MAPAVQRAGALLKSICCRHAKADPGMLRTDRRGCDICVPKEEPWWGGLAGLAVLTGRGRGSLKADGLQLGASPTASPPQHLYP